MRTDKNSADGLEKCGRIRIVRTDKRSEEG